MKYLGIILFSVASLLSGVAHADKNRQFHMNSEQVLDPTLYEQLGLDLRDIKFDRGINTYMLQSLTPSLNSSNPLSDYEINLPHTTEAPISSFERAVVAAYMDRPDDARLAKFLAIYHYERAFGLGRTDSSAGKRIKHRILAHYFLQRVKTLNGGNPMLDFTIRANQAALDSFFNRGSALDAEERRPAHLYFFDSFNYREENRYLALDKLFDELAHNPKNAMTNTLLNASNFWIGGEARQDDPTMLYNYVLSSFFSIRSMDLAQQREQAWKADPASPRFRLAPILGGLSIPARRWLAQLANDRHAVAALDQEHREWRVKNRAFHAFTVGMALFEEPENFAEAAAAYGDAFAHCAQAPDILTCGDGARFSFNIIGFALGYVDFLLKQGRVSTARAVLNFKYDPKTRYNDWTYGKPAWEHREQNLEGIAALYANADPSDDPRPVFLLKKKWGASTMNCSTCHQAQGRVWSEQEKATQPLPPESVATIDTWPSVTTRWYGGLR